MDLKCEHASILGKKMSPFDRAVTKIFNFFFVQLLMGHPINIINHKRIEMDTLMDILTGR